MAGETLCTMPSGSSEPLYGYIELERKSQLYPDPVNGGGSTRPASGQAWPRGNTRGNG